MTDADTRAYIDQLRAERDDADDRYRELQARWRAGLKAAQAGESPVRIEAALTGTDVRAGT